MPVGMISYSKDERNELWIIYSFVKKEFRRKGVYKKIFKALIRRAQELEIIVIRFCVSIHNKTSNTVHRRLGCKKKYIEYAYPTCMSPPHKDKTQKE